MDQIVIAVATALAAKMLADVIRRGYGFAAPGRLTSASRGIETDPAYAIAFAAALPLVLYIGLDAALAVAIVLRISAIVGDRILLTSNHSFLELYLALVCWRLQAMPEALAAVLQAMTVTLWIYAAFQKLYQREYHDGTYFYISTPRSPSRLRTWSGHLLRVPAIEGDYAAIDPAAQRFCRRLGMLVLAAESVLPLLALSTSGSPWGALFLLAVVIPVGVLAHETNFMLTNVLMAAVFLVPFEMSAFARALGDPVIAGLTSWYVLWPPLHAMLARRLRFSPWRLAGWGMYSRQIPRLDVVLPGGALKPVRDSATPTRLLREFGACRIGWLRDAIHRQFHRRGYPDPTCGVVFRWYRRLGDRFVTTCILIRNGAGEVKTFEIGDERTADEFKRYLASVPLESPHAS
jgi:hypothetical protein